MKRYKGKEVQVRVEPFSSRSYCIYYREKKWFNLFNSWERYCYTWSSSFKGPSFSPNQPYLFDTFDKVLEEAKRLKSNPELIDKNNEKRWKKYNELLNQDREERNRTITL
jgi:hypothetical protein